MTTVSAKATKAGRRLFPGMIYDIRVSSSESNGSICIADLQAIPGCEPPRHVHHNEDEVFILKEGTATFFIGDDIVNAAPGDVVLLPVNVPHHFTITSAKVKATIIMTPGKLEEFFEALSVPFEGDEVPPVTPPTEEQVKYFVQTTESFGMKFV